MDTSFLLIAELGHCVFIFLQMSRAIFQGKEFKNTACVRRKPAMDVTAAGIIINDYFVWYYHGAGNGRPRIQSRYVKYAGQGLPFSFVRT